MYVKGEMLLPSITINMSENIMNLILESSLMAGIASAAVMLLRIPLKKAPKHWSYILWAVVFFRCLCPFSVESTVSLFNAFNSVSGQETSIVVSEVTYSTAEAYQAADVYDVPQTAYYYEYPAYADYSINTDIHQTTTYEGTAETVSESPSIDWYTMLLALWISGAAFMILYAVISYIRLMTKVSTAVKTEDGAYETDLIHTAFSSGFFPPKIYLPCGLSENERRLIITHERVHIRRLDFIFKPLAFFGLALHWFNPLIWVSFVLMTKDMELSCDEAVLKILGSEEKKAYSEALLRVSIKESGLASLPLAFAETGIKERVRNVLGYKKQKLTGVILSAAVVLTACAALGTDPVRSYAESVSDATVTLVEGDAVFSEVWDYQTEPVEQNQQEDQREYEKIAKSLEAEKQEFLKKFHDFSFDIDLEQAIPYGRGTMYPEPNTVYLFSTPAAGINMYGYYYNGRFPIVIIEHDGITDAFMQNWTSQMIPAMAFCNDYDGDGENEIAACYHIGHGTGVNVHDLVLYKKNENDHFIEYRLDPTVVKNSVDISVDNDNREITYELNGITFTNSYPEGGIVDSHFHDSGGVKPEYIGFDTRVSYHLDENNIMLNISPDLLTVYAGPDIIADVNFTGNGFSIENIRFDDPISPDGSILMTYTYPDGTTEEYLITESSHIPVVYGTAQTEYSIAVVEAAAIEVSDAYESTVENNVLITIAEPVTVTESTAYEQTDTVSSSVSPVTSIVMVN